MKKGGQTKAEARRTPCELAKLADAYFEDCRGLLKTGEDGVALLSSKGEVMWKTPPRPCTLAGLALALGFDSRAAMTRCSEDKAYAGVIARAVTRVEEYAETRLYDREGLTGAKFVLSSAFAGWTESKEPAGGEIRIELGGAESGRFGD